MYSSGPAFAGILYDEGNDVQKKIAQVAVEKQWGSTMVLTEPDAGSDVAPAAPRPCRRRTAPGTSRA